MWGQRSSERRADFGMICALEKMKNRIKKMIEVKSKKDRIWKDHLLKTRKNNRVIRKVRRLGGRERPVSA
jgi:hypothetical protein